MKERFENRKLNGEINIKLSDSKGYWRADKADICSKMIQISESYLYKGFTLTLRQLYYQLVGKDLIPNHDKVYKKIGSIKDDIVYSGYVDWECYEDRGRVPYIPYCNDSISQAIEATLQLYRLNRQLGQHVHLDLIVY